MVLGDNMRYGAKLNVIIIIMSLIFISLHIKFIPTITSELINPLGYTIHDPISISFNSEFTSENGVTSGNGTEENPYIIENWEINGGGANNGIYISFTDSYFIIRNCYIHNTKDLSGNLYGILLNSVDNGIIEDCLIKNNNYGIYMNSCSNFYIINNNFSSSDNGIQASSSSYTIFGDNIFKGISGNSLNIQLSYYNTISNNYFMHNNGGVIGIRSSNQNQVFNNKCYNSGGGISLYHDSHFNLVYNNDITNSTDRAIFCYGNNNTIFNNSIYNNDGEGIYVWTDHDNVITNNTIIGNNLTGIVIRSSDRNLVSNNLCQYTGQINYFYDQNGISLRGSNHNIITNNICNNNMGCGILVYQTSSYNTIENNICNYNNETGIVVCQESNNLIISDNLCNSNFIHGIQQWQSSKNLIKDNKLFDNRIDGIEFWRSDFTTVTNNEMKKCGIFIYPDSLDHMDSFSIDTTNSVNGRPIYYWVNKTSNNIPAGAGQVILVNCSKIHIEKQNVSDNSVGIYLAYSDSNFIKDITSNNNSHDGILMYESNLNSIESTASNFNKGFEVDIPWYDYNKGQGINLIRSDETTIKDTNCIFNRCSGIYLNDSSLNLMENNQLNNNDIGLDLYESSDNLIENNKILENKRNINLYLSSDNIFENCSIYGSNSNYDFFLENH